MAFLSSQAGEPNDSGRMAPHNSRAFMSDTGSAEYLRYRYYSDTFSPKVKQRSIFWIGLDLGSFFFFVDVRTEKKNWKLFPSYFESLILMKWFFTFHHFLKVIQLCKKKNPEWCAWPFVFVEAKAL